ncbi:MAG TPA: hypothetical protein VGR13_00350 [Actinomycetota bacterium]|jgi:hypothetical protein|nr:hypothetical protein [Actinomycetota bacterium]
MRQELTDEGISYAFLDWRNPFWKDDIPPYYVILLRTSEPNLAAPGDPVRTTIEGSRHGELYGGKDAGEASVHWVIPNVTSCSTVELWLNAPDMTVAQARNEAVMIAESLQPAR